MNIIDVKNFLMELANEKAIELTLIDTKNTIYHFFNNNKHYSLAKVNGVWELLDFDFLDVIKCYKTDFDVMYNLYNDI